MSRKNYLKRNCPLSQSMAVIGGQWTLLIARDLMNGINKFDNIQKSLNISRNLLAQRLRQMEKDELTNKVIPEGLKRAIYKPTQKCFDLTNIVLALAEWSEKWAPDPLGPRIKVLNLLNGKDLKLSLVSSEQANKLDLKSVKVSFLENT